MNTSIQLLLVEDSVADAALLTHELNRSGYTVSAERVESAEALQQALDRGTWDLVLCDYTLPQFSGAEALRLVRERDMDVPFIFVSGTMGEDIAVQAMKSGAQDYIMKDNLARLVPAVRRELREAANRAARRAAEQSLRESELQHRRSWESCPDAVLLMDSGGRIYSVNPAAESLFGRASTEILSRNFFELLPKDLPGEQLHALRVYFQRGTDAVIWRSRELAGTHPDHSEFILEASFSDVDLHGERRVIGFIRDVTARKLAERELRKNEEQFAAAREIQQGLFPMAPPVLSGFDIAGVSLPADAAGGDYFDYLPMTHGRWGVIVGDVTGHGLGPALLAAETRAYFRVLIRHSDDLQNTFALANRVLAEDTGGERFITVILLRLDPGTRTLVYANAGHPPGYVLGADGEIKMPLKRTGIALGLFPNASFRAGVEIQLTPGDLVLLLTDGVSETMSPDDEMFGMDRTVNFVRKNRFRPARDIVRGLCRSLKDFRHDAPQSDDVTLMVIKVL